MLTPDLLAFGARHSSHSLESTPPALSVCPKSLNHFPLNHHHQEHKTTGSVRQTNVNSDPTRPPFYQPTHLFSSPQLRSRSSTSRNGLDFGFWYLGSACRSWPPVSPHDSRCRDANGCLNESDAATSFRLKKQWPGREGDHRSRRRFLLLPLPLCHPCYLFRLFPPCLHHSLDEPVRPASDDDRSPRPLQITGLHSPGDQA